MKKSLDLRYNSLREKIAAEKAERAIRNEVFQQVWNEALEEGFKAGEAVNPRPMVICDADPITGRPLKGGNTYHVPEGVCGFVWIIIKPGNCAFANWLKKEGHARPDSYNGGVSIWISHFNQSMERKEAMAYKMAEIFKKRLDLKLCYANSRMD